MESNRESARTFQGKSVVKAEVTLGVNECTDNALSVVLGEQRTLYSSIFALCGGSLILVVGLMDALTMPCQLYWESKESCIRAYLLLMVAPSYLLEMHEACFLFSLAFICFSFLEMLWFNSL